MNNFSEKTFTDTDNNYVLDTENNSKNLSIRPQRHKNIDQYVDTLEGMSIVCEPLKKRKQLPEYKLFIKNNDEYEYYKQYSVITQNSNKDVCNVAKDTIETKETYIDSILKQDSLNRDYDMPDQEQPMINNKRCKGVYILK